MHIMNGCRKTSPSQYVTEVRPSETRCHYEKLLWCVLAVRLVHVTFRRLLVEEMRERQLSA